MKKDVNPAFVAVALLGVIGIVAIVAWSLFRTPGPAPATPEMRAEARRWVEGFKSQARQPGQAPAAPGALSIPAKPTQTTAN
jgi:hypothetical protein